MSLRTHNNPAVLSAAQQHTRTTRRFNLGATLRCFVATAPLFATAVAFGQFTVPPSTTDVLDVSRGTIVTAATPGFTPEKVFGFEAGSLEPGNAFAPNLGIGNSCFIELQTTDRVLLSGIRLYAKNDGSGVAFRRAMRAIRFRADVDGDGTFETTATDTAITVNYNEQPGNLATASNFLELNITFNNIIARKWRVEFEQGTSIGDFEGIRIIEVDGVTDGLDVSHGAMIAASTSGFPSASAAFGAVLSGTEPSTAFAPNVGVGNSSLIEVVSASSITLSGVRVQAGNDGPAFNFRRAMQAFRFLADVDGDGIFETTLVDTPITINYANQPGNVATGANSLDLTLNFAPIRAANWRVEFEQGTSGTFSGVRIFEVDGIAADVGSIVQPANVTTSYTQVFSGIGRVSSTFDQSGLNQPYVSGVTNFDAYVATTVHQNSQNSMMLVNSNGANQPNGVVNLGGTITLDLRTDLSINALGLWTAATNESITAMAVYADSDGNLANGGAVLLGTYDVANTLAGQSFEFPAVETRFVHIEVLGHSGTNFIRHGEFAVRHAPAAAERGDMNCDGVISILDVNAFVLALTDPAAYATAFPGCSPLNGDFNNDGATDGDDIQAMVELIIGG